MVILMDDSDFFKVNDKLRKEYVNWLKEVKEQSKKDS